MPNQAPLPLLHYLRRLAGDAAAPELTDAVLLERFVAAHDEAAFELLLWRHGALVLGVCRGVLRHEADVEDAFQGTFLALARKAGSIGRSASLVGWLYQVAYHVALKARAQAQNRAQREQTVGKESLARTERGPADEAGWREVRPFLHEEVNRLPPRYRLPVVLCYLEGKTNEEAARELGWTKGTVSGRLARARDLLRRRLTRRGVLLPVGLLTAALVPEAAPEVLSAELFRTSARAALAFAAGEAVPARPAALAKGVLRAMNLTRVKIVAAVLLVVGAAGVAAGLLSRPGQAAPVPERREDRPAAVEAPAVPRDNRADLASPEAGILIELGTNGKRPLKVGDTVERGQILARIDDRLARADLAIAESHVVIAQAEFDTARATAVEAKVRLERAQALQKTKSIAAEELSERQLAAERYESEARAKRAAMSLAQLQVQRAHTVLDMHQIHSPSRAVIRKIYKRPGEGVKALEPVVQIEPVEE